MQIVLLDSNAEHGGGDIPYFYDGSKDILYLENTTGHHSSFVPKVVETMGYEIDHSKGFPNTEWQAWNIVNSFKPSAGMVVGELGPEFNFDDKGNPLAWRYHLTQYYGKLPLIVQSYLENLCQENPFVQGYDLSTFFGKDLDVPFVAPPLTKQSKISSEGGASYQKIGGAQDWNIHYQLNYGGAPPDAYPFIWFPPDGLSVGPLGGTHSQIYHSAPDMYDKSSAAHELGHLLWGRVWPYPRKNIVIYTKEGNAHQFEDQLKQSLDQAFPDKVAGTIEDRMLAISDQLAEQRALDEYKQRGAWGPRYPEKALQMAIYKHQCPMCLGYLRDRGGVYTCDKCPFEYPPGGEHVSNNLTGQPDTTQCAWCGKIQQPDGTYAPGQPVGLVTHGICPQCATLMMPSKSAAKAKPEPRFGTFGYLNGHLLRAGTHHQGIMATLLSNGWTWDDLMNAKQAWGWFGEYNQMLNFNDHSMYVKFTSDSGFQNDDVKPEVLKKFEDIYGEPINHYTESATGVLDPESYGKGLGGKKQFDDYYAPNGGGTQIVIKHYLHDPIPPPPGKTSATIDTSIPDSSQTHEYYKKLVDSGGWAAFGYIKDTLFFGKDHSSITTGIIKNGWDYEHLARWPQIWGWCTRESKTGKLSIRFASDDKWMENKRNASMENEARMALESWYDSPIPPIRTAANIVDTDGVLDGPGYYAACFGWIDGTLYLGNVHHAAIIAELVKNKTHTWESLMSAKQMWGWITIEESYNYFDDYDSHSEKWEADVNFASDDAKQSYGVKAKVVADMKTAFPWVKKWSIEKGKGHTTQDNYGERARRQYIGYDFKVGDIVQVPAGYSISHETQGKIIATDDNEYEVQFSDGESAWYSGSSLRK